MTVGVGAYELRGFSFNLEAKVATAPHTFIVPDSDGLGVVAVNGKVAGVNMIDVPAGGTLTICKGILPVVASEAIAIGNKISTTTSGYAAVADAEAAAIDEVKGIYNITITTGAAAGDKITIAGKEYTCSADGLGDNEFAASVTQATVASALKVLLAAETAETAANVFKYTWTVANAIITGTEKTGGAAGVPAMVVTKLAETGTIVAAIATGTPGVAAVSAVDASEVVGMALTAASAAGELLSVLLF